MVNRLVELLDNDKTKKPPFCRGGFFSIIRGMGFA